MEIKFIIGNTKQKQCKNIWSRNCEFPFHLLIPSFQIHAIIQLSTVCLRSQNFNGVNNYSKICHLQVWLISQQQAMSGANSTRTQSLSAVWHRFNNTLNTLCCFDLTNDFVGNYEIFKRLHWWRQYTKQRNRTSLKSASMHNTETI